MQDKIIKAALYLRVSTEEQALHGSSLTAQEEELLRFAHEHNMKVVGIYRDEGNSARQPASKRKVMQELLADIEAGKVDRVLITKLDRWFRNVRDFHKVQEILDKHGVTWQTTLEDYSTASADSRLKVNLMLAVAENESDRTSERIKFVLESKRRRKELAFGGPTRPLGYKAEMIDGIRRLVKDPETEPIANDFWNHVRKYNSVRLAGMFCNQKYGLSRAYKTWMNISRQELYTGTYRGVEEFCPAYITHQDWEYLMQSHAVVKKTQRDSRVYLFTGLCRCPICGGTLKATYKTYPNNRDIEYKSYRCNRSRLQGCEWRRSVSELKLEKYLLENVEQALKDYVVSVEMAPAPKKKDTAAMNLVKLNERMRRLNAVYIAGNLDDDEYLQQTAALKKEIEAAKKVEQDSRPPDLEVLKQFLSSDFKTIYQSLALEDKRRMWRSIVSEIHFAEDSNKIRSIKFRA